MLYTDHIHATMYDNLRWFDDSTNFVHFILLFLIRFILIQYYGFNRTQRMNQNIMSQSIQYDYSIQNIFV